MHMTSLVRSSSSSVYSTIPPYATEEENTEYNNPLNIVQSYHVPDRNPTENYQIFNPYANSLWYDARGEIGNEAINDIKERSKRKADDSTVKPLRIDSFYQNKKVDSPIANRHFFTDDNNNMGKTVVCDSPIHKTIGVNFTETKYRKYFKELIATEQKYVKDLKLIDSVYRAILRNSKKYKYILNKNQEAVIFSNFESIIELSDLLLKDITKAFRRKFNGHLKVDINEHFDFIKIESINIGDILRTQFIRLKFAYTSYFKNFSVQIATLKEAELHGGPKISKWLEDCAYLAKSRSDCWDLPSLLIKPIQRLPKYVLLIDSLLENSNEDLQYKLVEDLYDAKTELEKLLYHIEQIKGCMSDTEENAIDVFKNDSTQSAKKYGVDRADYIEKVNGFKRCFQGLLNFRKEVEQSLDPLIDFILDHKDLAASWQAFMAYDDAGLEEHYISSIYSSYLDKVDDHKVKTRLIVTEIKDRIINAIDMSLEHCSAVKTKINKHNSNRGAYAIYLKNSESSKNFYHKVTSKDAQEYIAIENEIRDELPTLLDSLLKLTHYLVLLYNQLILKWLKLLSGSVQLEQYRELLENNDLNMGHNFDIIEIYFSSRNHTKEALKDICTKSPEFSSIFSIHPYNSADLKISASKVVRKLFGI